MPLRSLPVLLNKLIASNNQGMKINNEDNWMEAGWVLSCLTKIMWNAWIEWESPRGFTWRPNEKLTGSLSEQSYILRQVHNGTLHTHESIPVWYTKCWQRFGSGASGRGPGQNSTIANMPVRVIATPEPSIRIRFNRNLPTCLNWMCLQWVTQQVHL